MWSDRLGQGAPRFWPAAERAGLVVTLCVVAVLWQSFFWLPEVSGAAKGLFAALTLVAFVRPAIGLLVTAALATLGGPLAALLGGIASRGPEAVVLAFLAGWLLRTVVSRTPVFEDDDRLAPSLVLLFAVVVLSVGVALLAPLFAEGAPPAGPYVWQLVVAVPLSYLGESDPALGSLYQAALLAEGLLLLGAVRSLARLQPAVLPPLVRMLAAGAVAAALLSLVRLAMGMLRSLEPSALLESALRNQLRLSFHTGDLNAGASHFVMAAFVVFALAWSAGSRRTLYLPVVLPVVAALWLTGSRMAVVAGLAVAFAALVRQIIRRRSVAWVVIAATALLLAISAWKTIEIPEEVTVDDVLEQTQDPYGLVGLRTGSATRWWFLQTSLDMWRSAPVFGVGIGRYFDSSRAFMPAPLREIYLFENAHNNFAQIGAELGLVGLLLFLWLLWEARPALRYPLRIHGEDTVRWGLYAGLAAFLITCLGGHPLLVAAVAYPFWLTLGAAVSWPRPGPDVSRGASVRVMRWLPLALVVLVALLPVRLAGTWLTRDRAGVQLGFVDAPAPSGAAATYRLAGPTATLFVPADAQAVGLLLACDGDGSVTVEFRLDGVLANRLRLDGTAWTETTLLMPRGGISRPHRRLDLIVQPTADAGASSGAGARIRVREVRVIQGRVGSRTQRASPDRADADSRAKSVDVLGPDFDAERTRP